MKNTLCIALCAALTTLGTGCSDFLSGGELSNHPTQPVVADRNQRLTATQANLFLFFDGDLSRLVSMWMQQNSGTDRQFLAYDNYDVFESSYDAEWQRPYGSGGLADLRKIRAEARTQNDLVYVGVAQVWEALVMGATTAIWGDIPYSEAARDDIATPELDEQLSVYDALQRLLDSAIVNLGGSGAGPGSFDLVYGGDADKWIEAAYTLKARLYMHTAEVRGTAAYTAALTAAQSGISSSANDFSTSYSGATGEQQPWFQFVVFQRSGYISSGKFMVDLMVSRDDPRLDHFHIQNSSEHVGAPPGGGSVNPGKTDSIYTYDEPNYCSNSIGCGFDAFNADVTGHAILSWIENELIIAEAQYRLGNEPAALLALNAVRDEVGLAPVAAAGAALLQAIMEEKYVALYENIEVWNDWKRTCLPNIRPVQGKPAIPARLLYGTSERQTNPNVPPVAEQSAQPRNDNDPAGCP